MDQFHLIPIEQTCCPSLFKIRTFPPIEEVTNGRNVYEPVPMDDIEFADIPLEHLIKPGPHFDRFWLDTIPKIVGEPLVRQIGSGRERAVGWGIRINEGYNWRFILFLLLLYLVAVGLAVVLCALKKDQSTAYSLGSYLLAILTVYSGYQYHAWKEDS